MRISRAVSFIGVAVTLAAGQRQQNVTTSFGLKRDIITKLHIPRKRRGGIVYDLFASFFIAEMGKIIYNITRNNILKEDKPQ